MGAGQSDLYKGTYGDNPDNIPDEFKGRIKLPENDSQIKHIFEEREGHLPDTPENRKMLTELANDEHFHVGKDMYGNDWHTRIKVDGTQDWVRHQNQVINEGGKNSIPRQWHDRTGLNNDPWEE